MRNSHLKDNSINLDQISETINNQLSSNDLMFMLDFCKELTCVSDSTYKKIIEISERIIEVNRVDLLRDFLNKSSVVDAFTTSFNQQNERLYVNDNLNCKEMANSITKKWVNTIRHQSKAEKEVSKR